MQKWQIFAKDFAKKYPFLVMTANVNAIANTQCERTLRHIWNTLPLKWLTNPTTVFKYIDNGVVATQFSNEGKAGV